MTRTLSALLFTALVLLCSGCKLQRTINRKAPMKLTKFALVLSLTLIAAPFVHASTIPPVTTTVASNWPPTDAWYTCKHDPTGCGIYTLHVQ